MNEVKKMEYFFKTNSSFGFNDFHLNASKLCDDFFIRSILNETTEKTFEGALSSIWLKLIAIAAYVIIIFSSVLMIAFTEYERAYHGHYRTVINHLLSHLYLCVSSSKTNAM